MRDADVCGRLATSMTMLLAVQGDRRCSRPERRQGPVRSARAARFEPAESAAHRSATARLSHHRSVLVNLSQYTMATVKRLDDLEPWSSRLLDVNLLRGVVLRRHVHHGGARLVRGSAPRRVGDLRDRPRTASSASVEPAHSNARPAIRLAARTFRAERRTSFWPDRVR